MLWAKTKTWRRFTHLYCIITIRTWAPPKQPVAFHETVRDKVLVFGSYSGIFHQTHGSLVVDEDRTIMSGACYRLTHAFFHNFRGQILAPTLVTEPVTTLQACHLWRRQYHKTYFAFLRTCEEKKLLHCAKMWFENHVWEGKKLPCRYDVEVTGNFNYNSSTFLSL